VIEDEIPKLVSRKLKRLGGSDDRRGAAVAAILHRHFVLAEPGWERWPAWAEAASDGLRAVTDQLAGSPGSPDDRQALAAQLGQYAVLDDGSDEWQHALDLTSALIKALEGADLDELLEHTATTYLEGTFNVVANHLADEAGGVISQAEADQRVWDTDAWRQALAFFDGV